MSWSQTVKYCGIICIFVVHIHKQSLFTKQNNLVFFVELSILGNTVV